MASLGDGDTVNSAAAFDNAAGQKGVALMQSRFAAAADAADRIIGAGN